MVSENTFAGNLREIITFRRSDQHSSYHSARLIEKKIRILLVGCCRIIRQAQYAEFIFRFAQPYLIYDNGTVFNQ